MFCRAPAAAYFATSVLPSSMTSGGLLPAKAVSSLVPTSDHCWISTLTVTFGCFALKSAFTPSITDCGALPFISQMVSGPVSAGGLVLLAPLGQGAAASTSAAPGGGRRGFLGLMWIGIWSPSPFVFGGGAAGCLAAPT